MWQHLDDEPREMLQWFVDAMRESFRPKIVAVWLFDTAESPQIRCGDTAGFADQKIRLLHGGLTSHAFVAADGRGVPDVRLSDLLRRMQVSLATRLDHAGFSGLLILGPRRRGREYSDEEINAVLLLVELLGATLHSHQLQVARTEAERLAAQHEKLSALGLLTSCLAHEIKNPLSSIKTIATVMAEQFGPDHPQAEDVRLILGEVDRLSNKMTQFLQFARPAESTHGSAAIPPVVAGTLDILAPLAEGKDVRLQWMAQPDLPQVRADENTLREIMFNLVLNAIEAVEPGGHVQVDVSRNGRYVVTTVADDGPGIDDELRSELFTPFSTSKPAGTGLGLFIVRRHVEQLGGQITCENQSHKGTLFTVKLPFV
jgi:signal transduction histidine kinase